MLISFRITRESSSFFLYSTAAPYAPVAHTDYQTTVAGVVVIPQWGNMDAEMMKVTSAENLIQNQMTMCAVSLLESRE